MPMTITPNVLYTQMIFCGNYHEGRDDAQIPHIQYKINRYLDSYWRTVTAMKNQSRPYPNRNTDPLTYINQKLDATQLKKFEAWFEDGDTVHQMVNKAYYDGYKQNTGYWTEKEVFNIVMIAPKDDPTNGGKALSSKSPNWFRAMAMNVYKHFVICGGDWSALEAPNDLEG